MRKKILKISVLFVLFINNIYSQSSSFTPKINNIPTSPEAALLGRFGDIPVGYYTGTANVSVPIYTIKEGDVEIPIVLRYHGSGIKVADEATWVGLGWDLSPGGAIIQEVVGQPDYLDRINRISNQSGYAEFKGRFGTLVTPDYHFRYQQGAELNSCCFSGDSQVGSQNDSVDVLAKLLDNYGQPDIYHYDFAGHSGRFYINPETNEIVLLDKKETIFFEKINNDVWTATTMDGTVFHFGTVETAYSGTVDNYSGYTHKLDYISFKNGKSVNFEYVNENYSQKRSVESYILYTTEIISDPFGQMGPWTVSEPITTHNAKTLNKITTNDAIINFNLEDREDILLYSGQTVKRLNSIDIVSRVTNKKTKTYQFVYSYFPYNLIGPPSNYVVSSATDGLGKRLKLDSLKEIGYNANETADNSKPAYLFDYDMSVTMPLKISKAVDFYGYYNGANNTGLLPDLDYFDLPYDSRYQNSNSRFVYDDSYKKSNRYANNNYAKANLLTKITYPTDGYTEFEYEPNSFTNQFIPDQQKIDQAFKSRNIEDKNQVGDITSAQFQLSKATTITFKNRINNGYTPFNSSPSDTFTYDQMYGSKIQLLKINITGGTPIVTAIKTWDLSTVLRHDFEDPNNYGVDWNDEIRVPYDPNPNVSYSVVVSLPPALVNNSFGAASVKSQFFYYDDTGVNTSVSNQCGLRIKSVKNYTSSGVIANHKSYSYYGGKLLNRFEPLTAAKAQNNFCNSGVTAWGDYYYHNVTNYFNRITISSDDFGIDGGNLIGYDSVEEREWDTQNTNLGKKVFTYFNHINQTKKGLPYVPYLKNGLIQKEEFYDRAGTELVQNEYSYSLMSQNIFFGIRINNQSFGASTINSIAGGDSQICNATPDQVYYFTPYDDGLNHKYSYSTYPLIAEHIMPTGKVTKQYFNGNELSTSESYSYNDDGKIKSVTTKNSNDEDLITKYFYAGDYPPNLIYANMIAYQMIGIPLRTEKYNGSELLSTNTTSYGNFNNGYLFPKFIYSAKGLQSTELRVTCDSYDSVGNLKQYTLENGHPVTIIWGYKQTLPIAKIENASSVTINGTLIQNAIADSNSASPTAETNLLGDLKALRDSLPDAMVTTYTYKHLVGVSSITNPKGETTYYTYDAFGRLINVQDTAHNQLSTNEYHYKTQN